MRNLVSLRLSGTILVAALAIISAPALAQTVETGQPSADPVEVDQVDRVPGAGFPSAFARSDNLRVMRPGALLVASFDRNFDGMVTVQEVDVGAAGAFSAADKNGDGVISGFEQSDWATAVGSFSDILSNPMTFDTDLDRAITPVEFAAGVRRIADGLTNPSTNVIAFADLVQPLGRPGGSQAERAPAGRGDPRGRGDGGRQASPQG